MSSPSVPVAAAAAAATADGNPFPDADLASLGVMVLEKEARTRAIMSTAAYADLSTRIVASMRAWTSGHYRATFHFHVPIALDTLRLLVEQLLEREWECACGALDDDPAALATDAIDLCPIDCDGTPACLVITKERA